MAAGNRRGPALAPWDDQAHRAVLKALATPGLARLAGRGRRVPSRPPGVAAFQVRTVGLVGTHPSRQGWGRRMWGPAG